MQLSLSKSSVGVNKLDIERRITDVHQFIYKNNYFLFHINDMKAYKISMELSKEIEKLQKLSIIDRAKISDELNEALNKLNLFVPKTIDRKKVIKSEKTPITSISLNVAQECNMRCIYCYGGAGEYNEKGLMNFETAKKSVDFLLEKSMEKKDISIVFFGGEPLLNFSLMKKTVKYAIERVKNSNKKLHFSITTNGTLFNEEINKFLNKYHFSVTVSFDGDKEIQDLNRPMANKRSSYDTIKPKLMRFLKSRDGKATARATVTNSFKDLQQIRSKLSNIGFNKSEYAIVTAETSDKYAFDNASRKIVLKDIENQANEFLNSVKNKNILTSSKIIYHIKKIRSREKSNYFCGAGKGLLAVSISGDIYPCHRFVGMEDFKFGNLDNFNFTTRNNFLTEIVNKHDTCGNCWARYLCGGGCYHDNYVATESIKNPNQIRCDEIKKSYEMAIYAYDNLSEKDFKYLK